MKDDSSSHRPELTPEKSSERGASAVPPPPPEAPKQSKTTATASTGIPIQPKPTMGVTQPGMSANMNADTLGRQVLSGGTSTSTTTTGVVSSQNKNKVPEGSGAAKPLPSTNYTNMKLSPDVLNALQLSGLGGLPHQQGAVGNRQAQPSLAPNLQQAAASSQNFGNLLFSLGLIPPQSTTGSSASGGISILSPSFQAGMLGYGSSNNSGRSQQQQMSRLLPNPPRAQVAASSTSSVEQRPMVCAPATATGTSTAPKRVVVPCRARGMPLEHNFQTAYFEIRDDIKHGDGLVCSYPACRNKGIKFLYCSYCRDPVAKRNFKKSHSHDSEEEDLSSKSDDNMQKSEAIINLPEEERLDKGPLNSTIITTTRNNVPRISGSESSSKSNSTSSRRHHKRSHVLVSDNTSEDDGIAPHSKLAKFDAERRQHWDRLLAERPEHDDSPEMSKWLMNVMSVSDPKKALGSSS